jgi:tetratricopeptide (TPR) repeat protein
MQICRQEDVMTGFSLNQLIDMGVIALNQGDTTRAFFYFQDAAKTGTPPVVLSCLGYCLAKESGEVRKGRSLCLEAVRQDPGNALHYLNLGRTCLLAGQKQQALQAFRKGLKTQRHPGIIAELKKMGVRRPPLFPSLPRDNPLNRYLGMLCQRLGLRG